MPPSLAHPASTRQVFLGRRKYFVSVDVGGGRIQWYAFLNVPPGGVPEQCRRGEGAIDYLRPLFEGWSDEVKEQPAARQASPSFAPVVSACAACTPP